MTIAITFGERKENAWIFFYKQNQGEQKDWNKIQQGLHPQTSNYPMCILKVMEHSNTHNHRFYNIIFKKILVTHTRMNVLSMKYMQLFSIHLDDGVGGNQPTIFHYLVISNNVFWDSCFWFPPHPPPPPPPQIWGGIIP